MKRRNIIGGSAMKRLLMGTAALTGLLAGIPASAQNADTIETVVVTGYQQSLLSAAFAKKEDIGFSDSIFAEDIGKFPDSNIAEAMNRIPGVVLNKDPATGEGLQISIRGLGSQYTKVVLNNTPIAVATSSGIDQTNSNRETDLNMFPGELFSNVSVAKSSRADQLEGGAAGTVNMRSRRPFDKKGPYLSYNLTGTGNSITNGLGGTAALIASDTWNTGTIFGDVGVLVGVVGNRVAQYTSGFDDGNGGWNTPTIKTNTSNVGQCATSTGCDNDNTLRIGSDSITIPAVMPRNVVINSASGHAYSYSSTCPTTTLATVYNACNVNAYALADLNPGLGSDVASITSKLTNALFPRLLRNMYQRNDRWKYNGVMSLEVRPTNALHFFVDMVAGKYWDNIDRTELTQPTRTGTWSPGIIPANVVMNSNNLVTSYTAYNAQWAIDTRHYSNTADFFSINPGLSWQATDLLYIEASANVSRSHWLQSNAEIAAVSCSNTPMTPGCTPVDKNGNVVTGGVVTTNNFDGHQFVWTSNIDVNNPHNYQYATSPTSGGTVSVIDNKRYTQTYGAHLDLTYGGDFFRIKGGVAYDVIGRSMIQGDAQGWTTAACKGFVNTTGAVCDGRPGSLVAQQDLYNFLVPGPAGFLTTNYKRFENVTDFKTYNTPTEHLANGCVYQKATYETGNPMQSSPGSSGCYEERVLGSYLEAEGKVNFDLLWGDQSVKYNVGLRYVSTRQTINSPYQMTQLPQTVAFWGNQYYDYTFVKQTRTYDTFLPSASLVYQPFEDLLIRAAASRTMTRASLPLMTSNLSQSSFGAQANQTSDGYHFTFSPGNPNLKPYYSTNIDLGVEYYTGKEGYVSVGAFRKFLNGVPIGMVLPGMTFADLAQFGITYGVLNSSPQWSNLNQYGGATGTGCNDDATCASTPVKWTLNYNQQGVQVYTGLEFGYVQPLDFILEDYGLKGFGIRNTFTNIDFKQSASNVLISSNGSAPIHPTTVPHYSYNGTVYWQGDGLSARLSYNYTSGYYASNSGANGVCLPAVSAVAGQTTYLSAGCVAGAYIRNMPYSQFDFASTVKLSKLLGVAIPSNPDLSVNVTNIFRAKYNTYFQFQEARDRFYLSNQTFSVALKGTF